MDNVEPTSFPRASEPDRELETALAEIDAAIALVSYGGAVRVRLVGFAMAGAVAGVAAAHAQGEGVEFRLDRAEAGGPLAVIVGPVI